MTLNSYELLSCLKPQSHVSFLQSKEVMRIRNYVFTTTTTPKKTTTKKGGKPKKPKKRGKKNPKNPSCTRSKELLAYNSCWQVKRRAVRQLRTLHCSLCLPALFGTVSHEHCIVNILLEQLCPGKLVQIANTMLYETVRMVYFASAECYCTQPKLVKNVL